MQENECLLVAGAYEDAGVTGGIQPNSISLSELLICDADVSSTAKVQLEPLTSNVLEISVWRDGVELHCKRLSELTEEIECTSGRMKISFHRESLEGDAWTNFYLARTTDQALVVKQDEFGIAAAPPVARWWITTLWNRFLLVVRNDK